MISRKNDDLNRKKMQLISRKILNQAVGNHYAIDLTQNVENLIFTTLLHSYLYLLSRKKSNYLLNNIKIQ